MPKALRPSTRYAATLDEATLDPLTFRVRFDDGGCVTLSLADTELLPGADPTAALAPAMGQTVEIELREVEAEPYAADIWYPEPIIEDGEVEYVSFCHLRTLLLRHGCVRRG